VKRRRGKPKQATKVALKLIIALMYENGIFDSKRSDDAFREIAAKLGVSEQTVRQAVTKFRKPLKADISKLICAQHKLKKLSAATPALI